VGRKGSRDRQSLSGKAWAQDDLEDKNILFLVVSLGLSDLRGSAHSLDTMQLRKLSGSSS
jgi:hypothetical protein